MSSYWRMWLYLYPPPSSSHYCSGLVRGSLHGHLSRMSRSSSCRVPYHSVEPPLEHPSCKLMHNLCNVEWHFIFYTVNISVNRGWSMLIKVYCSWSVFLKPLMNMIGWRNSRTLTRLRVLINFDKLRLTLINPKYLQCCWIPSDFKCSNLYYKTIKHYPVLFYCTGILKNRKCLVGSAKMWPTWTTLSICLYLLLLTLSLCYWSI